MNRPGRLSDRSNGNGNQTNYRGRGAVTPSTTPSCVTQQILDFCHDDVGIESDPVFVAVKSEGYRQNDCYANVKLCIEQNGGNQQQGWIIWESEGFLLQAEHHAVWSAPNGNRIDVSPKLDRETSILFLPDSRNLWTGDQIVLSIHRLLSNDPMTRQIVAMAEAHQRLRNAAFKCGEQIPTVEQMSHMVVQMASPTRGGKTPPTTGSVGRNAPCPCGSGRKYKKCCGQAGM